MQAALVFQGKVVSVDARWNVSKSHIQTFVTFEMEEVIKGTHASATLTLSFIGGTVGNTTEYYEGLIYPQHGEKGIYFVENPNQTQLNPLVGWSQGHYKIIEYQGINRMVTAEHLPIESVSAHGLKSISARAIGAVTNLESAGNAQGLKIGNSIRTAVSVEHFKHKLIEMLDPSTK